MGRNSGDFLVGANVSIPEISQGADAYARSIGLIRPRRNYGSVIVNPEVGERIAREYEAAPEFDEQAVPNFKKFGHETERQFDFLTRPKRRGGMGVDVTVTEEDPYTGPRGMLEDLKTGRISVLSSRSTGGHPLLTTEQNDMFRAVHDVFGHAATGRGFDRHGEEAAWMSHRSMYTPEAVPAMTTETRGQNSTYVFGSRRGQFPTQKIAILPSGGLVVPIGRRSLRQATLLQARQFHKNDLEK
jgi:hypothetical protein